jgi:hypothetical protein
VARIIRAAKQAGATEVVVPVGEKFAVIRLGSSTPPTNGLEQDGEIVL